MIYFPTVIFYFSFIFVAGLGFLFGNQEDFLALRLRPNILPVQIQNPADDLNLSAKSVLLIDNNTGSILYEKNPTSTLPIASITKLMTALVFLDTNPNLEEEVQITAADRRLGNQIYLVEGDKVRKKDLLNLMLVASSNEAAAAIARISNLDDFAEAMNKKALSLGMRQTKFSEPTGLDVNNISHAYDLAKLAQVAFLRKEIKEAALKPVYKFLTYEKKEIIASSTDKLLIDGVGKSQFKVVGAKTGYIDEVGYCFLLWAEKADWQNQTLILLGASSQEKRWQEAGDIIDWSQKNYKWQ